MNEPEDKPEPKWVVCRGCETEFKAFPHWMLNRWMYANTCEVCAEKFDRPQAKPKKESWKPYTDFDL